MKKKILIDLIGGKYLKKNEPVVCTYDPPNSWIDSELYFIYLMKIIESNNFDVEEGLKIALMNIYEVIDEENRYLNFFLTNGKKLWVFRKGETLFYSYDSDHSIGAIASSMPQHPSSQSEGKTGYLRDWQSLPENMLAVLEPDENIKFITLR